MKPQDFEDYQKSNVKASKSQMKEYIALYAEMVKKLKNENSPELESIKKNINDTYSKEIYFTLADTQDKYVKLIIKEGNPEYIIPVFTDIREYAISSAKLSKLFLEKLEMKVITPEDIALLASEDDDFQGFVINPHSQNFNMDRNGCF